MNTPKRYVLYAYNNGKRRPIQYQPEVQILSHGRDGRMMKIAYQDKTGDRWKRDRTMPVVRYVPSNHVKPMQREQTRRR